MRSIVVLNKRDDSTKVFECVADAIKYYGYKENQFYNAINGKTNKLTKAGYLVYDYKDFYELKEVRKQNTTANVRQNRDNPVYMLDPYTNEIIDVYENLKEAADDIMAPSPISIQRCCRGYIKTYYGYKWEYVGDDNLANYIVELYCDTNKLVATEKIEAHDIQLAKRKAIKIASKYNASNIKLKKEVVTYENVGTIKTKYA